MLPKFSKWRDYAMFRSLETHTLFGPFTNNSVQQIMSPNERRLAFIIANCMSTVGFAAPDGITPSLNNGIALCAANLSFQPLILNVWEHGTIVQRGWFAEIGTPNWKVLVIETLAGGEFLEDYPGSPRE
jgi:hypothetical protein